MIVATCAFAWFAVVFWTAGAVLPQPPDFWSIVAVGCVAILASHYVGYWAGVLQEMMKNKRATHCPCGKLLEDCRPIACGFRDNAAYRR